MEKEMTIVPPEGYEIDRENSTFECIKFKKIEKLDYNKVVRKLFLSHYFFINNHGEIIKDDTHCSNYKLEPNNCTSKKQAEKLLAINKLMNVAKYLNGDWKPNWYTMEEKFYICFEEHQRLYVTHICWSQSSEIYFKSKELAKQAIEILGEDTIKLALSTDW